LYDLTIHSLNWIATSEGEAANVRIKGESSERSPNGRMTTTNESSWKLLPNEVSHNEQDRVNGLLLAKR